MRQFYSPVASGMHFVRGIAFGSGMRYAHWKQTGEQNTTVSEANNTTFAKQKYHAEQGEAYHLDLESVSSAKQNGFY